MSLRVMDAFNRKLSPQKAQELLLHWFKVGDEFEQNPANPGIVVGFGKKFIRRGGRFHKHAGTYIDFSYLQVASRTIQGPTISTWAVELKKVGRGELSTSMLSAAMHTSVSFRHLHDITNEIDRVFIRIDDTPRYEFWEGDIVAFRDKIIDVSEYTAAHSGDCRTVLRIEYNNQGKEIDCWLINEQTKVETRINSPEDIVLIRRGNLWKMEHGEELKFANIEEEARFYQLLGMSHKMMQNLPLGGAAEAGFVATTNTDEWSMPDALRSVQNGIGNEIKIKDKKAMTFVVIKYDHAEFAARMRAHTLAKFGLAEETSA